MSFSYDTILLVTAERGDTGAATACARWLADGLHARLVRQAPIPRGANRIVTILDTTRDEAVDLIVLDRRGAGDPVTDDAASDTASLPAADACELLGESSVPVLLLPRHYTGTLPWQRVLVPVSGEAEIDHALTPAVHLAAALSLEVHVAHVVTGSDDPLAAPRYTDSPHHEYPARLGELISRVLPVCRPEETGCISDVVLCRGDVAAELAALIEQRAISLVILGWHSEFAAGRADLLKRLLATTTVPVLLLRPRPEPAFTLRIGDALESPPS